MAIDDGVHCLRIPLSRLGMLGAIKRPSCSAFLGRPTVKLDRRLASIEHESLNVLYISQGP